MTVHRKESGTDDVHLDVVIVVVVIVVVASASLGVLRQGLDGRELIVSLSPTISPVHPSDLDLPSSSPELSAESESTPSSPMTRFCGSATTPISE